MMVMVILAGLTVILVSVCMMGVSMWTFQECYNVLGDFGWYYGDFFMENPRLKDESKSGLSYVGIYRCATAVHGQGLFAERPRSTHGVTACFVDT